MKYIKLFEKKTKYKFKIVDYVKVLSESVPRVDMENREKMIYQIYDRRKRAQAWSDDANFYNIKQVYEPCEKIDQFWDFHERALRDLTEEEREELELFLIANKYNI